MSADHESVFHLLGAGAAAAYVGSLKDAFGKRHHCVLSGEFSAVGAIRERFLENAACDALILSRPLMDELAAMGLVDADGIRLLGHVGTALATVAGVSAPRIDDGQSLRAALLASSAIYLPDPQRSTAGRHLGRVLAELDILDRVRDRLRPFPNGATAMRMMAAAGDSGALGCAQGTEIIATAGVAFAGALSGPYELKTAYCAAVPVRSTQPEAAAGLIDMLCALENGPARRACGLAD